MAAKNRLSRVDGRQLATSGYSELKHLLDSSAAERFFLAPANDSETFMAKAMRLRSKRLSIPILAGALLFVLVGGAAYATIPDGNGIITACYDKSGALRVIDAEAGDACKDKETLLTWNEVGPQGVQGPKGDQGPQGPAGVADYRAGQATIPVGVHFVEVVFSSPMPDDQYVVSLTPIPSGQAAWTADDACRYLTGTSKTTTGFWIDIRRCAGPQVPEPVPEDLFIDWIAIPRN